MRPRSVFWPLPLVALLAACTPEKAPSTDADRDSRGAPGPDDGGSTPGDPSGGSGETDSGEPADDPDDPDGEDSGGDGTVDCSAEPTHVAQVYWPEAGPELCAAGVPLSLGALWIGPDDTITDLSGLECVCSVSTRMRIERTPALTTAWGLEQLVSRPPIFEVLHVPALTSLDQLGGERSTYEILYLQYVDALESLAFLEGTESVDNLTIWAAPALTSLGGLESISSVYSLTLSGTGLTQVDALSGVSSVGGLNITDSPDLTNLSGLANVTDLGSLTLERNASLERFGAFADIVEVGGLVVTGSPLLTALDGPRAVTARLELRELPALSDLNHLEIPEALDYIYVGETGLPHLDAFDRLQSAGDLYVVLNAHLESISGLSGLTTVDGHLRVVSNPALSQCHAEEVLVDGLGEDAVGGDFQVDFNGACEPE